MSSTVITTVGKRRLRHYSYVITDKGVMSVLELLNRLKSGEKIRILVRKKALELSKEERKNLIRRVLITLAILDESFRKDLETVFTVDYQHYQLEPKLKKLLASIAAKNPKILEELQSYLAVSRDTIDSWLDGRVIFPRKRKRFVEYLKNKGLVSKEELSWLEKVAYEHPNKNPYDRVVNTARYIGMIISKNLPANFASINKEFSEFKPPSKSHLPKTLKKEILDLVISESATRGHQPVEISEFVEVRLAPATRSSDDTNTSISWKDFAKRVVIVENIDKTAEISKELRALLESVSQVSKILSDRKVFEQVYSSELKIIEQMVKKALNPNSPKIENLIFSYLALRKEFYNLFDIKYLYMKLLGEKELRHVKFVMLPVSDIIEIRKVKSRKYKRAKILEIKINSDKLLNYKELFKIELDKHVQTLLTPELKEIFKQISENRVLFRVFIVLGSFMDPVMFLYANEEDSILSDYIQHIYTQFIESKEARRYLPLDPSHLQILFKNYVLLMRRSKISLEYFVSPFLSKSSLDLVKQSLSLINRVSVKTSDLILSLLKERLHFSQPLFLELYVNSAFVANLWLTLASEFNYLAQMLATLEKLREIGGYPFKIEILAEGKLQDPIALQSAIIRSKLVKLKEFIHELKKHYINIARLENLAPSEVKIKLEKLDKEITKIEKMTKEIEKIINSSKHHYDEKEFSAMLSAISWQLISNQIDFKLFEDVAHYSFLFTIYKIAKKYKVDPELLVKLHYKILDLASKIQLNFELYRFEYIKKYAKSYRE